MADLEDDNISLINMKRGERKQAHKHVTTKCWKTLHSDYKQIFGSEIPMVASSTWNHFMCQGQPIKKVKCVCAESV